VYTANVPTLHGVLMIMHEGYLHLMTVAEDDKVVERDDDPCSSDDLGVLKRKD
jgi:hypothetical protein